MRTKFFSKSVAKHVSGLAQEFLLGKKDLPSKVTKLSDTSMTFSELIEHRLDHDFKSFKLPVDSKIKPKVHKLPANTFLNSPQDPGLVCRGAGVDELYSQLQTKKIAHNKKGLSVTHNIPRHIVENDCQGLLIATTPDFEMAGVYSSMTSGFWPRVIPTHSFIAVMNPNRVITDPRIHSILNPELYLRYAEYLLKKQSLEDISKYSSVTKMAQDAKELTGYLVLPNGMDVSNKFEKDIQKIYIIDGLSRRQLPFMSISSEAHIEEWDNPDFKKRCYTFLYYPADSEQEYQAMNKRAIDMKLIAPEQRLLTIEDVEAVLSKPDLEEFDRGIEAEQPTVIQSVSSTIKSGDALELIGSVKEQVINTNHLISKPFGDQFAS